MAYITFCQQCFCSLTLYEEAAIGVQHQVPNAFLLCLLNSHPGSLRDTSISTAINQVVGNHRIMVITSKDTDTKPGLIQKT